MSDNRPLYELSDEELLAMAPPEGGLDFQDGMLVAGGSEEPSASEELQGGDETAMEDEGTQGEGETSDDQDPGPGADGTGNPGEAEALAAEGGIAASVPGSAPEGGSEAEGATGEAAEAVTEKPAEKQVDPTEAYKEIMSPFKASGKMIQANSVEEVRRLMQMGAHYAQKMHALKPNLKVMRMLENNQLLDESKLSFLIDLNAKKPEAIQQLLKDAKIDPLDLDIQSEVNYTPTNHAVSDAEMAFSTALEDVTSTPAGKDTVRLIETTWDEASLKEIYKDPEILQVINSQRESGIYDRITAEMDRRKMLGAISPSVSFLHAYKLVGDELFAQSQRQAAPAAMNQNAPGSVTQNAPAEAQREVTRRTVPPRQVLTNNDRAKAAAPVQVAPPRNTRPMNYNPLAMSDEEFAQLPPQF